MTTSTWGDTRRDAPDRWRRTAHTGSAVAGFLLEAHQRMGSHLPRSALEATAQTAWTRWMVASQGQFHDVIVQRLVRSWHIWIPGRAMRLMLEKGLFVTPLPSKGTSARSERVDRFSTASVWPEEFDVLLEATRALLWITSPADAKRIVTGVIEDLGGVVLPADAADRDALPVDVSFGDGEPIVPHAPPDSIASVLLERHLPSLVQDVRRALESGSQVERLAKEASIDTLTRLPNRRTLSRALNQLSAGDVVIMIDLDHFKRVNDTDGHAAGDEVLRTLGGVLREIVRERDAVGRFGGEEFVVILRDESDPQAFLERLRRVWEERRPRPVTFSAGIARAGAEPTATLPAADRAMYEAKEAGRDRWNWAVDSDTGARVMSRSKSVTGSPSRAFVAFSELEVGEGGRERVEVAFDNRLGAVHDWPGFQHLEFWEHTGRPTSIAMVSWWDSADAFEDYMRSEDHRRSHRRIPSSEDGPRPLKFRRFRVMSR